MPRGSTAPQRQGTASVPTRAYKHWKPATSPSKPKGLSMSSLASCKLRGFMSSQCSSGSGLGGARKAGRSCTKPEAMKSGPSLGPRQPS